MDTENVKKQCTGRTLTYRTFLKYGLPDLTEGAVNKGLSGSRGFPTTIHQNKD